MKRYLTMVFFIISILIIFISYQFDFYWNGILAWGLSFISLLLAAYFTKYIPNKSNKK